MRSLQDKLQAVTKINFPKKGTEVQRTIHRTNKILVEKYKNLGTDR